MLAMRTQVQMLRCGPPPIGCGQYVGIVIGVIIIFYSVAAPATPEGGHVSEFRGAGLFERWAQTDKRSPSKPS